VLEAEYDGVSMALNQCMLQATHARRWRQDRDPRGLDEPPTPLADLLGEI
jgi:hypothetical protein